MADDQAVGALRATYLDPYCLRSPRFIGIVDTDALLSSIDNDCRHGPGWQSRLLRMASGQAATLYAADHVYGEVYRGLSKIALTSPVPQEELRRRFEEHYLPVLHFVTVPDEESTDPQVRAITDPSDVPTGKLAKLVAPCVVFSGDKHLRNPGLAPRRWREVARAGVDLVEAKSRQDTTSRVVGLTIHGAVGSIKIAARRIEVSPWLLGGLFLAGTTMLLWPRDRRDRVGKYVTPVFETVTAMYQEATQLEQRGLHELREVMLPASNSPSFRQQVAIVLARQREPLLAQKIHELIQRHFPENLLPDLAEVREVLKEGPQFVRAERYRWSLGRQVAPWQDSSDPWPSASRQSL